MQKVLLVLLPMVFLGACNNTAPEISLLKTISLSNGAVYSSKCDVTEPSCNINNLITSRSISSYDSKILCDSKGKAYFIKNNIENSQFATEQSGITCSYKIEKLMTKKYINGHEKIIKEIIYEE